MAPHPEVLRHNERCNAIAKSYDSSVIHAVTMLAFKSLSAKDRARYKRQIQRFTRRAAEIRAAIIPITDLHNVETEESN